MFSITRFANVLRGDLMPSLSHQTDSLLKLKSTFSDENEATMSDRIAKGRPRSLKSLSKAAMAGSWAQAGTYSEVSSAFSR